MKSIKTVLLAVAMSSSALALGHGDAGHKKTMGETVKKEQKAWGIAGESKAVTRTIEIRMSDTMRFTPDLIQVREGETIRLVHRNGGKVMHEFVLGTKQELDEHAALMLRFPNMEHDEPHMAHVAAGKKGEIVWTFNRAGEFDFACLIAWPLPGRHGRQGTGGRQVKLRRQLYVTALAPATVVRRTACASDTQQQRLAVLSPRGTFQ